MTFGGDTTPRRLSMMVDDDHVYAQADELAQMFFYDLKTGGADITFTKAGPAPRSVSFSTDSDKVAYTLGMSRLTYKAPFASQVDDKGAWVPFQLFLRLSGSGHWVGGGTLHIEQPRTSAIDLLVQMRNSTASHYAFNMVDEIGYDDDALWWKSVSARLVNVFDGIRAWDPSSLWQAVSEFGGDSTPYDRKYGDMLAQMFVTESGEEHDQALALTEVISSEIVLVDALDSAITDIKVGDLTTRLEALKASIDDQNPGSVRAYNRVYRDLEGVLEDQSRVTRLSTLADVSTKSLSWALGYSYLQDAFELQDQFRVDALDAFLASSHDGQLAPATRDRLADAVQGLRDDPGRYATWLFVKDQYLDVIASAASWTPSLRSGLSGAGAGLAWDLASAFTPLGGHLDAAEKYELSVYASTFQNDARQTYTSQAAVCLGNGATTHNPAPDDLRRCATAAYTFLKAAYIARNAGTASVASVRDKHPGAFERLEAKNTEIAGLMAQLRMVATSGHDDDLGYLPSTNEKDVRKYDDSGLISLLDNQVSDPAVDGVDRTELIDYATTDIFAFVDKVDGMSDYGPTDGSTGYRNSCITVESNPQAIPENDPVRRITYIEIGDDCNYSILGVYPGMELSVADRQLTDVGYALQDQGGAYRSYALPRDGWLFLSLSDTGSTLASVSYFAGYL